MAFEFNHFSPQSFERMIQALCVHVLGPGVAIFGAGPDGGREAAFEGEIPFPSETNRWKGYTVVQAKCRENLRQTHEDAAWVCAQLKHDLDKFLDKDRKLRTPTNYILATNVTLSPQAKNGGKAKVEGIFKSYRKKLGLKAWAIWSADELRAYLENATDVRRMYTAWLTPSDVLARLIESLERPNLTRLVPLALVRDLRTERDVRLKDAGQESDKPVYLEHVFVDLPLGDHTRALPASNIVPDLFDEQPQGFRTAAASATQGQSFRTLAHLLLRAADKHDPQSVTHGREPAQSPQPLCNRIVLKGGPGQGKSTLSQFLSQVLRARMLSACASATLTPQTRDLLRPIMERAKSEALLTSGPVRFPIRVDLPHFADSLSRAISQAGSLSLVAHMAMRLSRDIDVQISADDLRTWLGTCPAFIVLDGLDEVPPTANRGDVLLAIEALWEDLHLVSADAIVVVTTRPQGYNDDLDPNYWEHWELAPLTPDDAVRYATSLAEVRLSDRSERQALVEELHRATSDPATSALLTSPLQVAILFGIAHLKQSIPRDRWDLFTRYYTLLLDREAQKRGSIIREHQHHIDALHQEAGFLLHVAAESAGNAAAFFTPTELKALITRRLMSEGLAHEHIESTANELARIATERLVLLAARIEGQIAFDVRSLQEYMAAAQITAASSVPLPERLRAIAPSAHWRHVLRIAASKVFTVSTGLQHYRSDVLAICHALDNGDLGDDGRITRSGAKLALELLTDGVSSSAPAFQRQLVRRCLALLDLGPYEGISKLVQHFRSDTAAVFEEELTNRLSQKTTAAALCAWHVLSLLLDKDNSWATKLMLANWPSDPSVVLDVGSAVDLTTWPPLLKERFVDAQAHAGAHATAQVVDILDSTIDSSLEDSALSEVIVLPPGYYRARYGISDDSTIQVSLIRDRRQLLLSALILSSDDISDFAFRRQITGHLSWQHLETVAGFARAPSKNTLAEAVSALPTLDQLSHIGTLPWVLESLLADYRDGTSTSQLSHEAATGCFGDIDDWRLAEERWTRRGLVSADFVTWNTGRYLTNAIATEGVPYLSAIRRSGKGDSLADDAIAELAEVARQIKVLPKRRALLSPLIFFIGGSEGTRVASTLLPLAQSVIGIPGIIASNRLIRMLVRCKPHINELDWLTDALHRMGQNGELIGQLELPLNSVVAAFNAQPSRRGLLPVLFACRPRRSRSRASELGELLSNIHPAAFAPDAGDGPTVQAAGAWLRTAHADWSLSDVPILAEQLTESLMLNALSVLDLMLESTVATHPYRHELLKALVARAIAMNHSDCLGLLGLLAADYDSRPSPLVHARQREDLALPSPVS